MTTHTFDEDKAWENITNRVTVDEQRGAWTIFGVACIGADGTSHGITVVADAATAFAGAKGANEVLPTDCVYYPVGITILPGELVKMMYRLAEEPLEGREG